MNFKRMQSRVFWGQMAAHDLDNTPLLIDNVAKTSCNVRQNSYCNYGRDSDTEVEKNSSGSLPDIELPVINDVTEDVVKNSPSELKIDVEINHSRSRMVAEDVHANGEDEERYKNAGINAPRAFALLDEGHGSMDSGFSDSERSSCPDEAINADNGGRRRRRRRRRSRDKPRGQLESLRCQSIWRHQEHPNPAHTSTPKRQNFQIEEVLDESSIKSVDALHHRSTADDECLGDFLYAAEPPEDDISTIASSSTSRGSTPSFNGPCYTRISSESSTKSHSRSFEKSQRIILEERSQASVKAWLKDLVDDLEPECCVTLQSKALPKRQRLRDSTEEKQTRDLKMMTAKSTSAATELLVRANGFTKNIQQVIKKISHLESGKSEREILRSIEDEAFSILSELGAPPPRRIHDGSLRSILSQLESLKNTVNSCLDTRLDFYIERVVRSLEEAPRESGSVARGALAALTALGLAGVRAGNSIARCSGVRALLTSLVSATRLTSQLRASTLRALASVCCCPLAINNFVREGGPEILVDLLASNTTPEKEKMEATALVVQITAPWTDALGLRYLEPFARLLVAILTRLAEDTSCRQTLLLAAAALNNLADSTKCCEAIIACETVRKLLRCVKKAPGGNIWLMEQVASLINKLAKRTELRQHLAKARASVALVSFLRMAPPGLEEAYHRLAVTAASALTRLCVDPEIARQVVAVGGADCLPDYCRMADDNDDDDDDEQLGLLRYTKSLRLACRRAAKQIHEAKASDYSIE